MVQYGWRVRASDWTMAEFRKVHNVSEVLRTPYDGMRGLGDQVSARPEVREIRISGSPMRRGAEQHALVQWQNGLDQDLGDSVAAGVINVSWFAEVAM